MEAINKCTLPNLDLYSPVIHLLQPSCCCVHVLLCTNVHVWAYRCPNNSFPLFSVATLPHLRLFQPKFLYLPEVWPLLKFLPSLLVTSSSPISRSSYITSSPRVTKTISQWSKDNSRNGGPAKITSWKRVSNFSCIIYNGRRQSFWKVFLCIHAVKEHCFPEEKTTCQIGKEIMYVFRWLCCPVFTYLRWNNKFLLAWELQNIFPKIFVTQW